MHATHTTADLVVPEFSRRLRGLIATALLGALAACGGGGPASPTAETYAVSGTVSGLRQGGNGLKIQISSGETFTLLADGTFAYPAPLPIGTSYGVTILTQPTKPDQTCVLSNGSGTVGSADISNIAIVCPYPAAGCDFVDMVIDDAVDGADRLDIG